jgi:hypothetical protein
MQGKKKDRDSWFGAYRTKSAKRVFVVLCFMDVVKDSAERGILLYESPIAVPLNWISRCWRFVALPADMEFCFPGSEVSSTDQRYKSMVTEGFSEFNIGRYVKTFGCE